MGDRWSSGDRRSSGRSASRPALNQMSSQLAGSSRSLDKQLAQLGAQQVDAEESLREQTVQMNHKVAAFSARGHWLRGALGASASAEDVERIGNTSAQGSNADQSDGAGPEDPESAAALLGRFWKLIEPAVLMQAIQDGRVQAWRARLVPAARSLVGFPERQFEALREARPEESTDLLRRTHAARKAWFSRLLRCPLHRLCRPLSQPLM